MAGDLILVVDDERDTRKLVRIALERSGHRVHEAATGEEALALVAEEQYELVILDVMMPRLSGFDVCRQLKSDDRTKDVPVIFLSAKGQTTDIDEGLDVGGIIYIVKPFSIKDLTAQVNEVLTKTHESPPSTGSPAL